MRNRARLAVVFLLCVACDASPLHSHEDAERNFHSPAARYATGAVPRSTTRGALHDWPVKVLSIGNNIASYQNYGSGGYFHHGLDIRAAAGSDVLATEGGKVVNIQNYMSGDAYWEVAILDDDGYVWQYHHVDSRSIPRAIHDAFKTGAKVARGTKIGEVFSWAETMLGERYHHVHLNILGSGRRYLNPFAFLQPLADQTDPVIHDIYIVQNAKKVSGARVTGAYTLAADVSDLILHTQFKVPPHSLEYVMGGFLKRVWSFDALPGGASNSQYVNTFFLSGTCGDYTCRRYVVDLGFKTVPGSKFPSSPGEYNVSVIAMDYAGNAVMREFDWEVY